MASQAVADNFTSRDDAKRSKQLQEARAAGTAAPELDAATGKMINPHNPQFITQAPWYLNQNAPSLKHHQAWNVKAPGSKDWFKRGTKDDVKTKFIKGACSNCGATTHQAKDCVERPRKVGAKFNGKNLMPDEYVEQLDLDYEGKRDRWNGYQPDDYKEVIDEWEKVEAERRKVKAAAMEERAKLKEKLKAQKRLLKKKRKQRRRQLRRMAEGRDDGTDTGDSDTGCDSDTDTDTDSDSEASDDEDLGEKLKDFDKTSATVATKDDKLRTTTRNLRIREDTAKYLLNLDVNSAFYDPKSRSMRENPLAHLKDDDQGSFRGDNYVRHAGDAKALTELTLFAWDAYKHGEKVHDFAQPTQALKMYQVYKERSKNLQETQQQELIEKYGGEEHQNAPRELLFAQNENYVEYARDGRVIKGRERALQKSKYEEDILVGNHSSPWGTWYCSITGKWGFACCHQTMKNAYCVPLKGKHTGEAVAELGDAGSRVANPATEQPAETLVVEEPAPLTGKIDLTAAKAAAVDFNSAAAAGTAAGKDNAASSSSSSASGGEGSDSDSGSGSGSSSSSSDNSAKKDAKATKKAKGSKKEQKQKDKTLKGLKLSGEGAAPDATGTASEPAASSSTSKLSDKRSSAFGHVLEDVADLNSAKVAEAQEREKKRRKADKNKGSFTLDDERNRKFNAMISESTAGELSPEEFEAYRLEKLRSDDPMAKFL